MSRARPKLRVIWPNPNQPRATLISVTRSGRERRRTLGPRTLLTLDQAAAVLDRPREDVQRAIHTRFLRAVSRAGHRYVTLRACHDFLREEADDGRAALAAMAENGASIPATEVYRQLAI